MHVIISWEIKATEEKHAQIDNAMRKGLAGYSWIHPLSMFYILDIRSEFDWYIIQDRLLSIAQNYSSEVNFLMSPAYDEETDYFVFQIPAADFHKKS